MEYNEIIFLKTLSSDWSVANLNLWNTSRLIRNSAFVDGGKFKAFSIGMHVEIERSARELGEVIDKFCNYYKVPESKSNAEKFTMISKKFHEMSDYFLLVELPKNAEYLKSVEKPHANAFSSCTHDTTPVENIIRNLRNVIKTCDNTISFINSIYKVNNTVDTRYDKTTSEDVIEIFSTGYFNEYNSPNFDYVALDKFAKDKGIDINSQEYGKIIVKRLRAFKQDTISTANKYFGKNSRFADLNIMDNVL